MDVQKFFAELKRRNVYKVAVAYAVVGWLLIQSRPKSFRPSKIPGWVSSICGRDHRRRFSHRADSGLGL